MSMTAVLLDTLRAIGPGVFDTIEAIHQQELGRSATHGELIAHLCWHLEGLNGKWEADEIRAFVQGLEEWRDKHPVTPPGPTPGPGGDTTTQPRRGVSLYGGFGDSGWDFPTFLRLAADAGLNATTVWCWGGWGPNWDAARIPFHRRSDGRWDRTLKNSAYFDDAARTNAFANSWGIRMTWVIVDLYGWSRRKNVVPDHPFKFCVQPAWDTTPDDILVADTLDPWLAEFCADMGRLLGDTADFITGNELPEKAFHYRIRDAIHAGNPRARVLTNRNTDVCTQYRNMRIREGDFAGISFHGWRDPAFVDRVDPTAAAGEPDTHRALLHAQSWGADPKTIIACSDGARNGHGDPNDAYDWAPLFEAFRIAIEAGAGVDHQSARKMALYSYGTHDLTCPTEDAFLHQLGAL